MKKRILVIMVVIMLIMVLVPITAFAEGTQVVANVNSEYTVTIPAYVNLGTLTPDTGLASQPFVVEADIAYMNPSHKLVVRFDGSEGYNQSSPQILCLMTGNESGPTHFLPYVLTNDSAYVTLGENFAEFTATGVESGEITVDTADIVVPGEYYEHMNFQIDMEGV